VLYGVERVAVEFFRGDSERGFVFGAAPKLGEPPGWAISFSQAVSFVTIPVGLLWLWRARRRPAGAKSGARRPASPAAG
jgi:prolipoprotein diacylglyceryltransferase